VVDFEQRQGNAIEGQNSSICVLVKGDAGIATNLDIKLVNRSSSAPGYSKVRKYFPSESLEYQCFEIILSDDGDGVFRDNMEIEFGLILPNQETFRAGANETIVLNILDNGKTCS